VTWCFYAGEEVAQEFNGLRHLWEHRPDLLAADAAILGEPTGGVVEAGCQGTLRVRISLAGRRAHTARPYTGRNAVHRLAPLLAAVAGYESRRPVLDGCEYVEQVQAVEVSGGVAGNVVPDEASVVVNHRFAPDRSPEEAEASLSALLGPHLEPGDRWELTDAAAGAPPALDHPVLGALVAATGRAPLAKQGWTDASSLWAHGIPAANFGPGDPLLAHTRDEHVSAGELDQAASVLDTLLRTER
jgi:succinyl-diaminopimelate desuccinylase